MIRQSLKDVYYLALKPVSRLTIRLYRLRYAHTDRALSVHLGCGANYLDGFVNIEGNFRRRADCLLDVTVGLPFPNDSVEFIYSCHMLEHLYIEDAIDLLSECLRVLKPGAYARITLPDADYAISSVLSGRDESKFPRRFRGRMGQAMNFLFCDGQHRFGYSFEVLSELASDAGFARVTRGEVGGDPNLPFQEEPAGSFVANLYK